MKKNGFSKTVLKNGLRVISERIPSVRSISIGIWMHVGSRDEDQPINGISHFIEHMHFKGTKKRNALQIARDLESRGGAINAFTSREHTCYYARILNNHLPLAMDILGDILNHSTFTPGNIKKEKSVILEEIKDIADSPGEYIHDLFATEVWPSHSLGRPIMGSAANITNLSRSSVMNYISQHYHSGNIVIAAAGDVSHAKLVELVKKYFKWPKNSQVTKSTIPLNKGVKLKAFKSDTQQSHVCIGFPSISFEEEGRYGILAANNILSGGMSSRLFQNVREKNGFCYTIYSYQEFFRDIGLFGVYFGADKKYVGKASELVLKELKRLKEKTLTPTEVRQIKDQLKGNLMLSLESTTNRMNRIARQEVMLGEYIDLDETCRNIEKITAKQIRDVVNKIFNADRLTCVTLGPTKQKELEAINWSKL
ncbi:MAG: insulinase family protein [candidate division Zixibacteria bacterium]|nr:insulinase family protein [candidate division Zixibacteria bacterium]